MLFNFRFGVSAVFNSSSYRCREFRRICLNLFDIVGSSSYNPSLKEANIIHTYVTHYFTQSKYTFFVVFLRIKFSHSGCHKESLPLFRFFLYLFAPLLTTRTHELWLSGTSRTTPSVLPEHSLLANNLVLCTVMLVKLSAVCSRLNVCLEDWKVWFYVTLLCLFKIIVAIKV